MFPFITKTWNPLGGRCSHNCSYCWSMGENGLVKKYNMEKYTGAPRLIMKEFEKKFNKDDFIFVCDMTDLFSKAIPVDFIAKVLCHCYTSPARFLLLTKNPIRYDYFLSLEQIPKNCILGATIESNQNHYTGFAPSQNERIKAMTDMALCWPNSTTRFVSIEPIMDFDFETFRIQLETMKPWAVAVGYDNYNNRLPEPPLSKTNALIEELKKFTTVYVKTLREANNVG